MKMINHRVRGRLLVDNGRIALLLHDAEPDKGAGDLLYLRYAFVTLGGEELIFPALIMDDWGSKIKSLALYDWFHEFASQFPRAELFGFDVTGQEIQRFLRELELYSKLPCYAFPAADTPLSQGVSVEAVLLPDDTVQESVQVKRPSWVKRPLRAARVSWWHVNPAITTFHFS